MIRRSTNPMRRMGARLSAALLCALALACACPDNADVGLPDDDARDSAAESFRLLQHAVDNDLINRFYYLQEHEVRDRVPYHVLATGWDAIKPALVRAFDGATILDITELNDESARKIAHGPNAIVRVRHANADGETIEESLLFVLEIDRGRWPNEFRPRWRVRYPWPEFQDRDEWFAALNLAGAEDGVEAGSANTGPDASEPTDPEREDTAPRIPADEEDTAPRVPANESDTAPRGDAGPRA